MKTVMISVLALFSVSAMAAQLSFSAKYMPCETAIQQFDLALRQPSHVIIGIDYIAVDSEDGPLIYSANAPKMVSVEDGSCDQIGGTVTEGLQKAFDQSLSEVKQAVPADQNKAMKMVDGINKVCGFSEKTKKRADPIGDKMRELQSPRPGATAFSNKYQSCAAAIQARDVAVGHGSHFISGPGYIAIDSAEGPTVYTNGHAKQVVTKDGSCSRAENQPASGLISALGKSAEDEKAGGGEVNKQYGKSLKPCVKIWADEKPASTKSYKSSVTDDDLAALITTGKVPSADATTPEHESNK